MYLFPMYLFIYYSMTVAARANTTALWTFVEKRERESVIVAFLYTRLALRWLLGRRKHMLSSKKICIYFLQALL